MKALLESLERVSNDWALGQSLGPQRLPAHIAMRSHTHSTRKIGVMNWASVIGQSCRSARKWRLEN